VHDERGWIGRKGDVKLGDYRWPTQLDVQFSRTGLCHTYDVQELNARESSTVFFFFVLHVDMVSRTWDWLHPCSPTARRK
jgi:hypothetical protein